MHWIFLSGLIYSAVATAANVHDLTPAADLRDGNEQVVYSDTGYQSIAKRPEVECNAWLPDT